VEFQIIIRDYPIIPLSVNHKISYHGLLMYMSTGASGPFSFLVLSIFSIVEYLLGLTFKWGFWIVGSIWQPNFSPEVFFGFQTMAHSRFQFFLGPLKILLLWTKILIESRIHVR